MIAMAMSVHVGTVAAQEVIDEVIAIVGEHIVLRSELEGQYTQYVASGMDMDENTRCVILEDLLYQKLLVHQADLDSVYVDDAQVQSEIDRRLRFFINQFGSEEKLEEFYNKSIVEIKADFHDLIEEQLRVQTMQSTITEGITVTPAEVRAFFNTIPKDSLPYINSSVEIAQIVKKPPVSEAEKERVKEKLNGIRERIMKGEDFGTLAFMYSEDPGSSRQNGELGFMPREALVPEFAAVAFTLKKGDVSEIVETQFGYHLISLIERRGEEANVRHILLAPKTQPSDLIKAKEYLDSIQTLMNTYDTLTFDLAALQFSDDEDTKMNGGKIVNQQTGTTLMDVDLLGQLDPSLFFTVEKMKVGEIQGPVIYQERDGSSSYRLLKLLKRTDPHQANLTDDYSQLQELAKTDKQNRTIRDWMNKRIEKAFVRLNAEFKNCDFEGDWMKVAN